MTFHSALELFCNDEDDEPPTRRIARRLPSTLRPASLPGAADAVAFAADVGRRTGLTRRQREPVQALAFYAFELVQELGLTWTGLSIDLLTGFLLEYEEGMKPARIAAVLSGFDLFGDY